MRRAAGLGIAWTLAFLPAICPAHPAYLTNAQVLVESDGSFRMFVRFDLLAYVLGDTSARIGNAPMEALLAAPHAEMEKKLSAASEEFRKGLDIETDRGPARIDKFQFPSAPEVYAWQKRMDPVLPVTLEARLNGSLPASATWVAFRFPGVLDSMVLQVNLPDTEPGGETVEPGATSSRMPVQVPAEATPSPTPPPSAP